MKLTVEDKKNLIEMGYAEQDFEQIGLAGTHTIYKERCADGTSKKVPRARVIELLGRRTFLSGLGRSAFHWSAVRETEDGKTNIYFNSSKLFKD